MFKIPWQYSDFPGLQNFLTFPCFPDQLLPWKIKVYVDTQPSGSLDAVSNSSNDMVERMIQLVFGIFRNIFCVCHKQLVQQLLTVRQTNNQHKIMLIGAIRETKH